MIAFTARNAVGKKKETNTNKTGFLFVLMRQ